MRSIKNQQRGDTIVEVLIAIAVVASVLGGAYVITNHTVKNSQQAQEHGMALKVAESQIEQLKSYVSGLDATGFGNLPASFCMSSGVPKTLASECKFSDGAIIGRYTAQILKSGSSSEIFTVNITWDGPTGKIDSVGLIYKVYPQ